MCPTIKYNIDKLKSITLSGKKLATYVNPFIGYVQNRQVYGNKVVYQFSKAGGMERVGGYS